MTDPTAPTFWLSVAAKPLTVRWVDVDGVDTRVIEAGDADGEGNTLVCLHGTGGHAEAFIHNLARLGAGRRVIAYDLPAHGWSSAPDRSYEIDGYCAHLEALLEHYALERVDVVGQSLGGWIAAKFAVTRPGRIRRLVLAGAGGTTFDPAVMTRLYDSSMQAVRAQSADAVRRRVQLIMHREVAEADELVRTRLAVYSRPGAVEAMRKALVLQIPEVRRRNLFGRWEDIGVPCLLVWGKQDAVVPLGAGEAIAAQVPRARLVVFDDCGHWPQFEHPEKFDAVVEEFLAAGHPG